MREIRYRGRIKGKKEWLYGFPINRFGGSIAAQIIEIGGYYENDFGMKFGHIEEIYTETIGQFTGLYDKSGKDIYEGDIVKFYSTITELGGTQTKILSYKDGSFGFDDCYDLKMWVPLKGLTSFHSVEVIGNIHDNPELLEG